MNAVPALSPQVLARAYRQACELELAALKPGNVHVYADGHGMRVGDFRLSARVSAAALTSPGLGLGERVYRAVRATREAVGCNTNLGIVLLAAPLLRAVTRRRPGVRLAAAVDGELASAGLADTEWVYQAIRLAAPAGLGRVQGEDVHQAPSSELRSVMRQAAARDRIARQYALGFVDVFRTALPLYRALLKRWRDPAWAAAGLYLALLRRWPDSHIVRKHGMQAALQVGRAAAPLAEALIASDRPQAHRDRLLELDSELKRRGMNPGTTADLTVATVLAAVLEELLSDGSRQGAVCRGHLERLSVCV